jgi:hypothetical protein
MPRGTQKRKKKLLEELASLLFLAHEGVKATDIVTRL